MMTLPDSSSEIPHDPARAYEQLHPKVQAWIWDQQWQQLRATQARAVGPILKGQDDVIISAPTASGKTEAAWLPICSALARDADAGTARVGVKALYVSPLKALINDQHARLTSLCEHTDLPVYRRHGDVTGAERNILKRAPDGLLLITPESLEALFVLQGPRIPTIFNGLRYVVVDELHAFIGTERGAQLQSLLHRVELALRRRVPRVALSATLADPSLAAEFLRPGGGHSITVIGGQADDRAEILMQLRGYILGEPGTAVLAPGDDPDADADDPDTTTKRVIAEHLFQNLRGRDNLVFANSRGNVETYTDLLRQICEDRRVPNEFFPHHGNLSKEFREEVEDRLKARDQPTTAICTSTLEMGIDIGSADSVAQIGAPGSVAALRQRLGRSGRRGQPATLRLYVVERDINEQPPPTDLLRTELFEMVAATELLLKRWYEPPNVAGLHLSTLIQQCLSVIAQFGGARAPELFSALCSAGPFARVTKDQFVQLLRDLGANDIIVQASDGTLLPGQRGERILNHYSFYSAFQTAEEYRLVSGGKTLGSIPVSFPVLPGNFMIFAGRRWSVVDIDSDSKVIELKPAKGGRAPLFSGGGVEVADGIRQRMRALYEGDEIPAYLDREARRLLDEGRRGYRRLRLDASPVYEWGRETVIFPWRGDRVLNTLMVVLASHGAKVSVDGVAISCTGTSASELVGMFQQLAEAALPDPAALARNVPDKVKEKHDVHLGDALLNEGYAARDLDVPGGWDAIRQIVHDARGAL